MFTNEFAMDAGSLDALSQTVGLELESAESSWLWTPGGYETGWETVRLRFRGVERALDITSVERLETVAEGVREDDRSLCATWTSEPALITELGPSCGLIPLEGMVRDVVILNERLEGWTYDTCHYTTTLTQAVAFDVGSRWLVLDRGPWFAAQIDMEYKPEPVFHDETDDVALVPEETPPGVRLVYGRGLVAVRPAG